MSARLWTLALALSWTVLESGCAGEASAPSPRRQVLPGALTLAKSDESLRRSLTEPGADGGFELVRGRFISAGERALLARPEPALDARLPAAANQRIELRVGGSAEHALSLELMGAAAAAGQLEGKLVSYPDAYPQADAVMRSWSRGLQVLYLVRDASAGTCFSWALGKSAQFSSIDAHGERWSERRRPSFNRRRQRRSAA